VVNEQSSCSPKPPKALLSPKFKIAKLNYLVASMSVQGCFGDGCLSGTITES